METIIGLLFILLPLIFKFIGRKLEQSGQHEAAGKFQEIAKALTSDEDDEAPVADTPVVVDAPAVIDIPEADDAQPVMTYIPGQAPEPESVSLPEETPREKIDPKKLVIYSEIMKPKF